MSRTNATPNRHWIMYTECFGLIGGTGPIIYQNVVIYLLFIPRLWTTGTISQRIAAHIWQTSSLWRIESMAIIRLEAAWCMCVLTSHTTQPQPIRRTGNGNILVLWSLPASQTLPRILAPEQTETIKTNKLRMTPTWKKVKLEDSVHTTIIIES